MSFRPIAKAGPPFTGNIGSQTYIDSYLTNYSAQYIRDQRDYIAGAAATLIPVELQSAKFLKFNQGSFLRDDMDYRPLGGRPPRISFSTTDDSYFAEEFGLEWVVDDRQRVNASATRQINLELNATRMLAGKSIIKRDVKWSDTAFKTGVWTFELTGAASAPATGEFLQFDQSGGDPIGLIDEYADLVQKATGFRPNTIVFGSKTKRKFRLNDDIVDRIKYTQLGVVTDSLLQSLLFDNEGGRVVTARGVYNTAGEGVTDALGYIMEEDSMWMGYVARNGVLDEPTAVALFAWTGLIPGAGNDQGGVVERYRDGPAHSDIFQQRDAWDMKVVAADLGVFFKNAVS